MTIGERIRAIRMARGMTQKDLAGKMNFSRSRVGCMEASRFYPNLSTLEMFAEALDVPIIRLIDDGDWEEVIRCERCECYTQDGWCEEHMRYFGPREYCSYPKRRANK